MNNYITEKAIYLPDYDDLTGIYKVWYKEYKNNKNNKLYKGKIFYEGKLVNSKRHGYGIMYKDDKENNTKEIIYDGIWVNDEPIDNIPLPEITHLNTNSKINLNINTTCEHLTFNYKNFSPKTKNIINEVNLAYYVPFGGGYDLYSLKNKAIAQTGLSFKDNKIEVNVTNSICNNLENLGQCIKVANDINNISNYILELDEECSNCEIFNRSWVCCGQFAPFLYIYIFLLFGDINDFIEKHSFNKQLQHRIPSYINDVATVFYKVFTTYGINDQRYHDIIDDIRYDHGISIPTVFDNDTNFNWAVDKGPLDWFIPYKNEYNKTDFKDNTPYLINLIYNPNANEIDVTHYSVIYRCDNYIIITDSWSSNIGKRYPVTRIMEIDMFIDCLNKLNKSYEIVNSIFNSSNISSSDNNFIRNSLFEVPYNESNPYVIKLLQEFLLYNFIIDALFLVPYYKEYINTSTQVFIINDISKLRIVNPDAINYAFEIISNPSKKPDTEPDTELEPPFNTLLRLGGFSKLSKKQTYKRKKGNKKHSKKYKKQSKKTK